ncbi:hypothetical protein [Streptomyces sp. NPDC007905]|uniref:hypothetical protein n=1 Tax=Streptomyces sp. NPDC007905 TaxID=3364788 RepID=UPI0036EBDF94
MAVSFAVLAVARWLRPLTHAHWAAGMTTVLSLLLGYVHQDAASLLPPRLAAIAVGTVLSVGASGYPLPVQRPYRRA